VATRPSELELEHDRRKVALAVAENKWSSVERKWWDLVDDDVEQMLAQLRGLRGEYEKLSTEHEVARRKLAETVRERQLLRFLSRFHVEDVSIPGLGQLQLVALVSFGVETAAEVERQRLEKIRGLSPTLINQLLAWRWGLEGMFKFDAAGAGAASDQKALDHWYAQRYRPLTAALSSGLEELRRKAAIYEHRRRTFLVNARMVAEALAQARADMQVF
jgi:DNA-binding helix-hairpin-helix protein with protein kinase domain